MKSEEAFFSSVVTQTFQFNTLSARLKIKLESPQKEFSSRAQLKMKHDDCIQLSIQPFLGIEMFRANFTNDSVRIIDRMNKYYMVESYENIKGDNSIDFNFSNLQALFANQIFAPGEKNLSIEQFSRFSITKANHLAKIKTKEPSSGLTYLFTANNEEKLLSTSLISNEHTFTWKYDNFEKVDKQRFPMKMTAFLLSDKDKKGTLTLTFSPPEIDTSIETSFKVPSGYKRVTFPQIVKLIGEK